MTKKIGLFIGLFVVFLLTSFVLLTKFGVIKPGNAELSLREKMQIAKQKRNAKYREMFPPSTQDLEQMKKSAVLCFQDDDCRVDPHTLLDCTARATNKYNEKKKEATDNCPRDRFAVCSGHVCGIQQLTTTLPR